MKVFVFNSAKCNGCYSCQIACKDEMVNNEWPPYSKPQPDTGHFWCGLEETVHGQQPKVRVEYRMRICHHCDDAPCMKAFPDALYKRKDGLVILNPEKAGNKAIVDSCPYGAIYWNEELSIAQKCTGCAHLVDQGELPHCVDHCPDDAWRFGDEADFGEELHECVTLAASEHKGRVYYKNLPGLFIGGEVWDPEPNEVVENAKVVLKDADGKWIAETITDGFGDFWFRKLEPGDYTVVIRVSGYEPIEKPVHLDKSLNIGDFPLQPAQEEEEE